MDHEADGSRYYRGSELVVLLTHIASLPWPTEMIQRVLLLVHRDVETILVGAVSSEKGPYRELDVSHLHQALSDEETGHSSTNDRDALGRSRHVSGMIKMLVY
jgi:hypothetical protein